MIRIKQMVKLTINDQQWVGQVMEIRDDVALIRLYENMHYHAHISELAPVCPADIQETS